MGGRLCPLLYTRRTDCSPLMLKTTVQKVIRETVGNTVLTKEQKTTSLQQCVLQSYERRTHFFHSIRTLDHCILMTMTKLSIDKLSEGIDFYSGTVAEVYVEIPDRRVSQFIAKYEQDVTIIIERQVHDGFVFKIYGSGDKEVRLDL